jgi:hypothetical protein
MNAVRGNGPAAVFALMTGLAMVPNPALAQDVEHRPWSELVVVVGHDVALSLPDGYVEGRAVAVTNEALEVDVDKTSSTGAYRKGLTTIPRARVSVIRLRKGDNRAPRVASQLVGQAAVMGGLFGLVSRNGIRGDLRGVGVQLGAATAGAVIGRRLDNREVETVIRVVPDSDGAAASTRRRDTCLAEPDDPNQSINRSEANGVRRTGDGSRADVDEHDSSDRRTAGQPVPRCGDR